MANTLNLQLPATTGSLETYIDAIHRIPLLSLEDEQQLARRYQQDNDLDAARQLVLAHLRFVVKVARGYKGYGLAQGDLVQEGNVGLMKAVKRFDPDVGVRLVSFAVHWIKAEIHEFILRNWRIVKVATTKAQRKLFFNLRSTKKALGWMNAEEVAEIAADLDVEQREVLTMEQRLSAHDAAFDSTYDGDDESFAPDAYLEDRRFEPAAVCERDENEQRRGSQLEAALGELDERSRDIVSQRWLQEPKATLHDLADVYGVSAERVRQLEQAAFKKIRARLPEFEPATEA
ncbi:MAG: RNA polymerase sigma factor RpoH [Gammaproteobacteria bacterium]